MWRFLLLCGMCCGPPLTQCGCASGRPAPLRLPSRETSYTLASRPHVVLKRGDVEAVIANNESIDDDVLPGHVGGHHGVASLEHARRDANLFLPKFCGLNFEFIHDGTTQPWEVLFEPRLPPMQVRRINDHTAVLYQSPTPNWKLESWLRYELLADGTIEMTLECVPHARMFRHDYIGLFFASYIHQPESPDIHFIGHEADCPDTAPRWIQAASPAHGKLAVHRAVGDDRPLPHDADFPVMLAFNDSPYRYREPWCFGVSHGMALVFMFREQDEVRFSQSPIGGGEGNPAWDFQWFIEDYEVGRHYCFVMRMMALPYESTEQIIEATARHRAALNP